MNHIIDRVSFGSLMGKFIKQLQNKIATALNVPMWQLFASPEEVQPKKLKVNYVHIAVSP